MTRRSSASPLARNVTENRKYAPASSHGTVDISFSVINHCDTSSADLNPVRLPSASTTAFGAGTYKKNEPFGFVALNPNFRRQATSKSMRREYFAAIFEVISGWPSVAAHAF